MNGKNDIVTKKGVGYSSTFAHQVVRIPDYYGINFRLFTLPK